MKQPVLPRRDRHTWRHRDNPKAKGQTTLLNFMFQEAQTIENTAVPLPKWVNGKGLTAPQGNSAAGPFPTWALRCHFRFMPGGRFKATYSFYNLRKQILSPSWFSSQP